MTTSETVTIVHQPRGDEHPYRAAPFERTPRDPVAGQPVELRAGTCPAGSVQALAVHWRIDDGPEQITAAVAQDEVEGATRWLATLPAAPADTRVSYRFVAEPGGLADVGADYLVAGWSRAGRVSAWTAGPTAVTLSLEGGPVVALSIGPDEQWQLRVSLAQQLDASGAQPLAVRETAGRLEVTGAPGRCRIQLDPYRLEIDDPSGALLWADPPEGGLAWLASREGVQRLALTWLSPEGEAFMGFGERFNAFDQRGQVIDSIVYEEYKNQGKRTYLPVPFFISSRGYGAHLVTTRRAHFDLAATASDRATLAVEDAALALDVYAGAPEAIIARFVQRVGLPALPPKWAFGLWMSSNEWNSQAEVARQVAETERHGIPATALVIEAWSDESTFYIFNDAQYTPRPGAEGHRLSDFTFPEAGLWPDPKGMVDDLHHRGVHLVLWQIPVLKHLTEAHAQHEADVQHALARDLVVHEADGRPYRIRPFWFHDGLVPDFTSAEAVRWWQAKRRYLVEELGVDGFKTDGGEHLWGEGLLYADGRTGAEANSLFPNLYEKAYADLGGPTRLNFSRAGYTGAQTVSTHWAGDENSSFDAFRHSITAGLTAGMAGVSFWGWDIGGFSGPLPSAELYLRATAMATFCPIMQYHSEFNNHQEPNRDRTPWNMQACTGDPDVIDIFKFYANLRMNLLPYIWSEAIKSSRSGLPMMRALPVAFPDDLRVREFPYQYLFGEALLVAPVAWEGLTELEVYLPDGVWHDLWSGRRYDGAQTITVAVPKHHIPIFARGGTALALRLGDSGELASAVGNRVDADTPPTFRSFPGREPATFAFFSEPDQEPTWIEVPAEH